MRAGTAGKGKTRRGPCLPAGEVALLSSEFWRGPGTLERGRWEAGGQPCLEDQAGFQG